MSIICPFCFNAVDRSAIEYRCVNQRCSSAGEPDHLYSQYLRMPKDALLGHVFKPESQGMFGSMKNVSCDKCHDHTPNPICPRCHNPLPQSSLNGTNNIISIVGTRGSGKSHYIAVLINELRKRVAHSMGAEFRDFVVFGDGGYNVESLYQETKYKPLYNDRKRLELTRTDMGVGLLEHDKIPLIYIWNYLNSSFLRKKTFTLSFFDTAGEDLQNPVAIATVARYLEHSKGIIFLVDPLQIPSVYDQIKLLRGSDPTSLAGVDRTSTVDNVLANITGLIRKSRGIAQGKPIDIPVAVTFSKIDEVFPISSSAIDMQRQSPHCDCGAFVKSDQLAVDGEIRSLLEEWGEGSLVSQMRGNFKDLGFFCVSSLGIGNAPDAAGNVRSPRPHRIEDPLLWLMSRHRLISTE